MTGLPHDVDVLVVGAGQAGLGTAYWLTRDPALRVLVVDRALPGLAFPDGPTRCPDRLEMAAYLRAYVERFDLPVRTGVEVRRLTGTAGAFVAETSQGAVRARHVVLASGPCARPHALPVSVLGVDLYWWLRLTGVLNAGADSRVARSVQRRGDAISGRQLRELVRAGRVAVVTHRVVAAEQDRLQLADGIALRVSSVLWCTGFRPDTRWLDVPGATEADGTPVHTAGASPVRGLHWMGLPWRTRLNSSIIDGVDRDARAVARRVRTAGRR